jgi:hypothetical protein
MPPSEKAPMVFRWPVARINKSPFIHGHRNYSLHWAPRCRWHCPGDPRQSQASRRRFRYDTAELRHRDTTASARGRTGTVPTRKRGGGRRPELLRAFWLSRARPSAPSFRQSPTFSSAFTPMAGTPGKGVTVPGHMTQSITSFAVMMTASSGSAGFLAKAP